MVTNRLSNGVESARTASILNILAGIWLIIAPFWMGFWHMPAALWNNLIVGIVVGVLALIRASYPAENVVLSWINLILGIWLIVAPTVFPNNYPAVPVRMDVILGIIIGLLSLSEPCPRRATRVLPADSRGGLCSGIGARLS